MKSLKSIIGIVTLVLKYSTIVAALIKALEVFHGEVKHLGDDEPSK